MRHLKTTRPPKCPMLARKIFSGLAFIGALTVSSCISIMAGNTPEQPPDSQHLNDFTAIAPAPLLWKLAGVATLHPNAPWKLVIITGTPSWSEYWRPGLAMAPDWLQVVVVDRPGFGGSEPLEAVVELEKQAAALSVLIEPDFPDQKIMLLGQSYGGPISALIAARHPDKVHALILTSAFFGERGPTINRLQFAGSIARSFLDRDMKNGLAELNGQKKQLPQAILALEGLKIPVIVLHGAKDTFVPIAAARRLAARSDATLIELPKGDHFLNQCCMPDVLEAAQRARNLAEQATALASR
jgi:pimeloyl-ACP methyl ester carboxylesterase